jgi:vitamin B12 transporter
VQAVETVHTVTAEEIAQQNARTLDEALNLLPGVSIRTGADGTPRIDMRGFRTRNVLLLLNGTPFNAAYDGQFDPSQISVENIAEIKVISGGGSVLYGPGGNGGVINIITKKGRTGLHGSAGAEAAEEDTYLYKGTLSGGTDKVDFFASGSLFHRGSFRLSNDFTPTATQGSGSRDNSDLDRGNAFANVGYSPSEKTFIGLTFSYLKGERGKPPVVNHDPNDPFSSPLKFERENDSRNYSVQLAASHDLDGPLRLKGWVFFNQLDLLDNRYDNANYDTQLLKGSSRTDSTTRISGANLQLAYDLPGDSSLTLGLMGEYDGWDADGFQQNQANKSAPVTRDFFDESQNFKVYSSLLQYEASFGKRFGLVLGAGYHLQDREEDNQEDYSYLVGAHYDLFPGTRLRASQARKIRFPSLKNLYDPDGGNPDLKAEKTMDYQAGVEQSLPAQTLVSLTGFYTDVSDFIEKDANGISANFQKYVFSGFEVFIENKGIENLRLRASYTFLHSQDKSDGSQRDQLQYRPGDKVSFEADYRFFWGTSIYASVLYVADQYFYDKSQVEKKRLPDYTVVDVKLSQDLFHGAWNVYIGANNVLDENYEQAYGFPQPGRTIYGGIGCRF